MNGGGSSVSEAAQEQRLRLGKMIGETVASIGRNIIPLLVISVLFFALPAILVSLYVFWHWSRLRFGGYGGHWVGEALLLACGLSTTALSFLGFAVSSRSTINDLEGDDPPISVSSIQATMRQSLSILGTGFTIYLVLYFAHYVSVSAGLLTPSEASATVAMLTAALVPWGQAISVAVPVSLHEGFGVKASVTKSSALTKGNRWPIFGLFLIAMTLFVAKQIALKFAFSFIFASLSPVSAVIVASLLSAILWAMICMAASIAITITYLELRWIKDGVGTIRLAEIFS